MKIQVTVKISTQPKTPATLELLVASMDTIESVKQRIASTMLIPFPDQKLIYNGSVLADQQKLGDCSVKEGAVLDFEVTATASSLAKQLSDLLQEGNAMSIAELGLVYSHKHGVTVVGALDMLGVKPDLNAFLLEQKFEVSSSGSVKTNATAAATTSAVNAVHAATDEFKLAVIVNPHLPSRLGVEDDVEVSMTFSDTVLNVKQRICESMGTPFNDVDLTMNGKLLDDDSSPLTAYLTGEETSLEVAYHCSQRVLAEQLMALLSNEVMSVSKLGQAYTCRYGLHIKHALRTLAWSETLEDFLQRMDEFSISNGAVALSAYAQQVPQIGTEQQLLAVHGGLGATAKMDSGILINQSEAVKKTAHLLKSWIDQQAWTSEKTRPSGELVETIAVHAGDPAQATSLDAAVSNAFIIMARLDEVKAGTYESSSVIVHQRPLLPHPTNPSRNVADPAIFDPRELMAKARSAVIC
mmetsp:Transcript_50551/g.118034  ORF Transcript_50551/g.118034 Transcript_50551/m.118034 type:complete len:468 (+) Transcript_50551:152-1555(+)